MLTVILLDFLHPLSSLLHQFSSLFTEPFSTKPNKHVDQSGIGSQKINKKWCSYCLFFFSKFWFLFFFFFLNWKLSYNKFWNPYVLDYSNFEKKKKKMHFKKEIFEPKVEKRKMRWLFNKLSSKRFYSWRKGDAKIDILNNLSTWIRNSNVHALTHKKMKNFMSKWITRWIEISGYIIPSEGIHWTLKLEYPLKFFSKPYYTSNFNAQGHWAWEIDVFFLFLQSFFIILISMSHSIQSPFNFNLFSFAWLEVDEGQFSMK